MPAGSGGHKGSKRLQVLGWCNITAATQHCLRVAAARAGLQGLTSKALQGTDHSTLIIGLHLLGHLMHQETQPSLPLASQGPAGLHVGQQDCQQLQLAGLQRRRCLWRLCRCDSCSPLKQVTSKRCTLLRAWLHRSDTWLP